VAGATSTRRSRNAPAPEDEQSSRAAVSAVEYAIALVAARSLPEKKLRDKIRSRYAADETQVAIERMRELRLVDDTAWAERFVRDRFERTDKGRHRIRMELVAAGIGAPQIDSALARVLESDAEREKAVAVLERMRTKVGAGRSPNAPHDAAASVKSRLFRRMLARGYPAALVRDLLDVS
jgi:regulatory protein